MSDSELLIERVVPGGSGLARRISGEVVLIPGALPGDTVIVRAEKRRGGVQIAQTFDLVHPSADRVESQCPYSQACGGCDLIELASSAQRAVKLDILRQALRRTGGILDVEPGFVESERAWNYRSRIRLQLRRGQVGFFKQGTHEVVDVPRCEVAHPRLNGALNVIFELQRSHPEALSEFQSLELRVVEAALDQEQLLLVQLTARPSRSASGTARSGRNRGTVKGRVPLVPQSEKAVAQAGWLAKRLGEGVRLRLGKEPVEPVREYASAFAFTYAMAGTFSQVNASINAVLIERVVSEARRSGARTFLDLYCGSGNFSLPLVALGLSGTGVEFDARAIELARLAQAAQASSSSGYCEFIAADSASMAKRMGEAKHHDFYDLVVLDPPRAGAKPVLDWVARVCRSQLIMISCDPVTLARDLKHLLARGFVVESVDALDMFPQTHHVESMAILKKS